MSNGYVKEWTPTHPLCDGRGAVSVHRRVLYDAIGGGAHPCHWCQRAVHWRVRVASPRPDDLVVDHLDGNRANNDLANLVPSCQACNMGAGHNPRRVRDDEPHLVRSTGTKLRGITKTCGYCGGTFVTPTSAPDALYCSRECGNASRRVTICKRGHERTPDNVSANNQCKKCMAIASAKQNVKRREARRLAREKG